MQTNNSTFLGFFPTDITTKQSTDTGMAMVLLLLLIGFFTGSALFYKLAIPVLLVNMIYPNFYYPVAILWLGLSALLGTIMSKIILTIVYMLLVVPIGTIRRWAGKDDLRLKNFKKTSDSVFVVRDHTYQAQDLEKPY